MAFSNARKKFPRSTHQRSVDARGGREVWIIDSDTDNENLADAEDAQGIPSLGQSFPGDFNLQVADKDTVQINKRTFEVTVVYAARQDGEEADEDDPLSQPAQITYSAVYSSEAADTAATGEPIATDNNEPFDPPITVDVADVLISITRNIAEFTFSSLAFYMNTINEDFFLGLIPHTCRIVGIRANKVTTRTPFYYKAAIDIQIRNRFDPDGFPIGWDRLLLHQGFMIWPEANADDADAAIKYAHALDSNGKRVTEPVLLNENGRRLKEGEQKTWLKFQVYKTTNFAAMNLGV